MANISEKSTVSFTLFGVMIGALVGAILWASKVAAEATQALDRTSTHDVQLRQQRDSLIRIEARLNIYNEKNWK